MPDRRSLIPPATLPLAYFALAHLALAAVFASLVVDPRLALAGARFLALLHLVTLGWISGSILGALYIVAPLALGIPLRGRPVDAVACVAFAVGVVGMAGGFWARSFEVAGWSAMGVLVAIALVGVRTLDGLRRARLPQGVSLHVALAFVNVGLTGMVGLMMALGPQVFPLSSAAGSWAAAHAHLGVLGWACMMIFGMGYRLVPMVVPTAMPTGTSLAISAVLLQVGTLGLAAALVGGWDVRPWAAVILIAFASFFAHVRTMLRARRVAPVDLPSPDWSTRHTLFALAYGVLAAALGAALAFGASSPSLPWAYGITGLLGFVSQMVVGIQGRLLPLHAWYREMEQLDGQPPPMSAHALGSLKAARAVFLLWLSGLPALAAGLMTGRTPLARAGAALLLVATLVNAWYGRTILARARRRAAIGLG